MTAACSGSNDGTGDEAADDGSVMVAPDYESGPFLLNVKLTDTGFEPETLFIPAGRQVRLVMRNVGKLEHHFRIARLVASDVRWFLVPVVSPDELENMSSEERRELGVGDMEDIDDVEHVLHHLIPSFVPFKEESRAGITPLKNEVHGYAQAGESELMTFWALSTGTFVIEDVLHPDLTGTAVIFETGA